MIKIINVTKTYQTAEETVHALKSVSAEIQSGEFIAIAGPSGSGKSTLLNLLGGLDRPTSGDIWIDDHNLAQLNSAQLSDLRLRSIGFIFQAYNLLPILTAKENVEYGLVLQGRSKEECHQRALNLLEDVGLASYADRYPSRLSGGQQQRVAVARALVTQPKLILADEPTANLDSKTASILLDLMEDLNKKFQVAFVFSSHDPIVLSRAKRIIYLHDGEIVDRETASSAK